MICQNCSADVAEGQKFCGKCGFNLAGETLASVSERLTRLEVRFATTSRTNITQRNLELETAEKVMSRVKRWTTLILYFAGIPAVIMLLALAVMFGKGAIDMHSIAANVQRSVNRVVTEAASQASQAEATANGALTTSKRVNSSIQATEQNVSRLKQDVESRTVEVGRLSSQIKGVELRVDTLKNTLNSQSQQMQRLTTQVEQVKTSRDTEEVVNNYPIFGKHVARSLSSGWIDPKQKTAGITYLSLNLSLTSTPNLVPDKVAAAITSLSNHQYRVFLSPIYVYAVGPNGSDQAVGMGLDGSSCTSWSAPASSVPCIFYFRAELKASAMEVRDLLQTAQLVPDNHVVFVDPKKLNSNQRETLELSGMDIAVVLGQQ